MPPFFFLYSYFLFLTRWQLCLLLSLSFLSCLIYTRIFLLSLFCFFFVQRSLPRYSVYVSRLWDLFQGVVPYCLLTWLNLAWVGSVRWLYRVFLPSYFSSTTRWRFLSQLLLTISSTLLLFSLYPSTILQFILHVSTTRAVFLIELSIFWNSRALPVLLVLIILLVSEWALRFLRLHN